MNDAYDECDDDEVLFTSIIQSLNDIIVWQEVVKGQGQGQGQGLNRRSQQEGQGQGQGQGQRQQPHAEQQLKHDETKTEIEAVISSVELYRIGCVLQKCHDGLPFPLSNNSTCNRSVTASEQLQNDSTSKNSTATATATATTNTSASSTQALVTNKKKLSPYSSSVLVSIPEQNETETLTETNATTELVEHIRTIQQSVRGMFESFTSLYSRQIMNELYSSLISVLQQHIHIQIQQEQYKQQNIYTLKQRHDYDDILLSSSKDVMLALQSIVQIHDCTPITVHSLDMFVYNDLMIDNHKTANSNTNTNTSTTSISLSGPGTGTGTGTGTTSWDSDDDDNHNDDLCLLVKCYTFHKTKLLLSGSISTTIIGTSTGTSPNVQKDTLDVSNSITQTIVQLLYHLLVTITAPTSTSITEPIGLQSNQRSSFHIDLDQFIFCIQRLQQTTDNNNNKNKNENAYSYDINLWDDFIPYVSTIEQNHNWVDTIISYYQATKPTAAAATTNTNRIDTDQLNYLQALLSMSIKSVSATNEQPHYGLTKSLPKQKQYTHNNSHNSKKKHTTSVAAPTGSTSTSSIDEVNRRVQQIREIVPQHYSTGLVEAALGYNNGDVEATVSLLLLTEINDWPMSLQLLYQMPSSTERFDRRRTQALDDIEARQIAKEKIRIMEQQQQNNAKLLSYAMTIDDTDNDNDNQEEEEQQNFLLDEYDDDYDEQYDDRPFANVSSYDTALYDKEAAARTGSGSNRYQNTNNNKDKNKNNYDAIKLYNQAVKEIVSDAEFWDSNRNANKQQKPIVQKKSHDSISDSDDAETDGNGQAGQRQKYRGPDRGKGGRIIRRPPHEPNSTNNKQSSTTEQQHQQQQQQGRAGGRSSGVQGRESGQREDGGGGGGRGRGGQGRNETLSAAAKKNTKNNINRTSNQEASTINPPSTTTATAAPSKDSTKNSRQKERRLDKRKELQRASMFKKSG